MDEASSKSQPQDKIIDIWCDLITLGVEKVNHQLLNRKLALNLPKGKSGT